MRHTVMSFVAPQPPPHFKKCVLFSLQLLSKIFLILRRIYWDFNETWIFSADWQKLKYQVLSKSVQLDLRCSMQMHMTKLTHAFCNFVNTPKNSKTMHATQNCWRFHCSFPFPLTMHTHGKFSHWSKPRAQRTKTCWMLSRSACFYFYSTISMEFVVQVSIPSWWATNKQNLIYREIWMNIWAGKWLENWQHY
jgi:hypothetical protein